MRQILCWTVVVGIGVPVLSAADTPERRPRSPKIELLLEQLGDRDVRVRDSASKAIADLGIKALPALLKGRQTPDPEIRRRLDELIPALERTASLMPKSITLHMTNKPLRAVLDELSRQTGYKINTYENNGFVMMAGPQPAGRQLRQKQPVYTFHFDKVPFWEALDKVSEEGGFILQQWWGWGMGEAPITLQPADSYVPFNYYTGAFKVTATGFYYNRSNNFGLLSRNSATAQQLTNENLTVNLQIAVEPKLPILRVGQVKLTAAEDNEGHNMLIGENAGNGMYGQRYYGGYYRSFVQQTGAGLGCASKTAQTVRLLKGSIPLTLLAEQKASIITERLLTSKNKKFKQGTATFHVQEIQEMPGKQYQISLNVTEENKDNPNDYSRIQSLQQRMEIQDDKGNRHQFYFNMMNFNGPNSAQMQLTIQPAQGKIGPPTRLVYYAWVMMEHDVEFEFHDLPLP